MTQLTDDILAGIAHDYYLSKLNIADISQKYNLSRYLVSKALDDAQKHGIVQISIQQQTKRDSELERKFQNKFHLKEVFILKDQDTTNQDNEAIVKFAAQQIQNYAKSAHNIGMSWGTLMMDIIRFFKEEERKDLNFIQLSGQTFNSSPRKKQLTQEAATKFNAKAYTLPAPLYVKNPQLIRDIQQEPFYQNLINYYQNLDLTFAGLGTFQSIQVNQFFMKNYAPILFKDIDVNKIAGLVFGHAYDIEGNFFTQLDNNICSISIKDLQNTPNRFVIVKNRFKTNALLGALRSGIFTHLVTSEGIAERVWQKANEN